MPRRQARWRRHPHALTSQARDHLGPSQLGFGLLAQLVTGRAKTATRWLWLIAAGAFFVVGLVTSEVWFGWATEEELQPNIDGLSVDETLLFGLLAGIASVVITRFVTSRRLQHHPKPRG